jgi:hypothetical protein
MTTQELWQLQALDAPRVSAAYIRHRARDLARRTRIRNGSDYAVGVLGTLFFAWSAWKYLLHRPLMLAAIALGVLAIVYLSILWHRLASAAQVPEDAGVVDSLSFYRRALERQRDARRGSWRRSLPPVAPVLIAVFASLVLEFNRSWALIAFWALLNVAIISVWVAFDEWGAKRLQREIDALGSLVVNGPAC